MKHIHQTRNTYLRAQAKVTGKIFQRFGTWWRYKMKTNNKNGYN